MVLLVTVGLQLTFWRGFCRRDESSTICIKKTRKRIQHPKFQQRQRLSLLNSKDFPCMKTETLPAFQQDDGTVLPFPLSGLNGSECNKVDDDFVNKMRLKFGRDKILPLADNVMLSGFPKTGTSLLQFVLWEILLQHYGMQYHISPSRIHRDITCMIQHHCLFEDELDLLLLTMPDFAHNRAGQCINESRSIFTIRRIDDALKSYCLWSSHNRCDLEKSITRAEAYATYYKVALNCTSSLPITYSTMSQAVSAPDESDAFLAQIQSALDILNWTQISDATIVAALKKSDMKTMMDLEKSLSRGQYTQKVGTGQIYQPNSEWTHKHLEILNATVTRELGPYLADPIMEENIFPY